MMPIDAKHHLLKEPEIQAIRRALHPRILIPMHYRLPDLEPSPDTPGDLGEIDPWLTGQTNVVRLESSSAIFSAGSLLPAPLVVVFPHSAKVVAVWPLSQGSSTGQPICHTRPLAGWNTIAKMPEDGWMSAGLAVGWSRRAAARAASLVGAAMAGCFNASSRC